MKKIFIFLFVVVILLIVFPAFTFSGTIYNEAIDGDLPHMQSAELLGFGLPNPNFVIGTVDLYSDAFKIDIGQNEILDAFILTSASGPEGASATFSIWDGPYNSDDFYENLITGTEVWDSTDVGSDFLDLFSVGNLSEGQYIIGFWHNNTPNPTYQFELKFSGINPVPEPTTMLLLCSGLVGLAGFGRKKFKK